MFFIQTLFGDPVHFFLTVLVVIPSICLHEYFHAQVALWCGDPTAAEHGHLTLNPLKQMGPWSMITFLLVGIAWGAVPVNPQNLTRRGRILTALAGPLMNLVLFILGLSASAGMIPAADSLPKLLIEYVFLLGLYNMILFIFNMMPVPGLDGWSVILPFLKPKNFSSEFFKGTMIFMTLALIISFHYIVEAAEFIMLSGVRFLLSFTAG